MLSLLNFEIKSFFSSPIGYLVISIFIILNGLFLWVFNTEFNIFNQGFADLNPFFLLAPWILLFLIPAVTMKSFAEEKRSGTLELLLIKPISVPHIVLGKFLGAFLLVCIAILFTLVYSVAIHYLGTTVGNMDTGSMVGSYIGLIFLVMSYTAIGIFTSTLTSNQIVAFLLAICISFIAYYGFESIATLGGIDATFFTNLGMKAHFESIGRGVLDSIDLIYFISITFFFLFLATLNLNSIKNK